MKCARSASQTAVLFEDLLKGILAKKQFCSKSFVFNCFCDLNSIFLCLFSCWAFRFCYFRILDFPRAAMLY